MTLFDLLEPAQGGGNAGQSAGLHKSPDAFKTISEVSEMLDIPQHVLRFWESRFSQIKPLKRNGGRRFYRPQDIETLTTIKHLLYKQGYTIEGAKKAFNHTSTTPKLTEPEEAYGSLFDPARLAAPASAGVVPQNAAEEEGKIVHVSSGEEIAIPAFLRGSALRDKVPPAAAHDEDTALPPAADISPQPSEAVLAFHARRAALDSLRVELVQLRDVLRACS